MAKLTPTARVIQGALITYLGPRMATDAALPKFDSMLEDVSRKNFTDKIPQILSRVRKATRTSLAQDADIDDLVALLDTLEESLAMDEESEVESPKENKEEDPNEDSACAEDEDMDDAAMDARKRLGRDESEEERVKREEEMSKDKAKKKLGRDETPEEEEKRKAEDKKAHDRRMARDKKRAMDARKRLGRDETPEEENERREKEHAEDKKRAMDARKRMGKDEPEPFEGRPETGGTMTKDEVSKMVKHAADEAVQGQRAIREAEKFVRPWVGDLNLAFDSAEEVHRKALSILGVKHTHIHPSALATVIEHLPRPGSKDGKSNVQLATDAKPVSTFADRFPSAKRIGVA